MPTGAAVTSSELEEIADAFLQSESSVPLLGGRAPLPETMRRADGRLAPLVRDELRYSTPELLAIEQRIIEAAVNGATRRVGLAQGNALRSALARRAFLSSEQQAMVRRLTCDGGQVVAVVGKAGSGKTTALAAAREAWTASGIPVIGGAVARRAARELHEPERQEIAPGDRDLPTAYESLARGLSSSRAQTVALDTAQEQHIRTASTADLRRMREALRSDRGDAEIAATVRTYDEVSERVGSLLRAADALERRLSRIAALRPSFHRRAARARRRSLEFEQLRKRDELARALATAMRERAALDARLSHLRTAPRPPPGENRAQLQRIEDELSRRASIERSVARDTAIVRDP